MLLPEQLQLTFTRSTIIVAGVADRGAGVSDPGYSQDVNLGVVGQALRPPNANQMATEAVALQFHRGRDRALEVKARELLRGAGAERIADLARVEWKPRLRTCAGRAAFRDKLITLNPRLHEHGSDEIDRTLRHELAHLLAQFRAGRRRILPHGPEWRAACHDLGIGDESRCHNLPFAVSKRAKRYIYKCPSCKRDFPRVRRIKRAIACLACCRAHNHGRFTAKFRLQLLERSVMT